MGKDGKESFQKKERREGVIEEFVSGDWKVRSPGAHG